jgi:predicted CXXCH cytochrome family protein
MKIRTAAVCIVLAALLPAGCSAVSRHKALTTLFDGVPPLEAENARGAQPGQGAATPATRQPVGSEHGPYAAKMCSGCHDPAAANGLIAPKDELCAQCHTLTLDKKYVHGPVAGGGCLVCHDPHNSRYKHLLVSDSDTFCLRCHDPQTVAKIDGHADLQSNCTTCHDAHESDTQYLLK